MAWEAIFATISPFLMIDDNTTKASKMNCKIPIWKVRNYLACSDDISMLILKAAGIWLVHRTKCFRLDSNCETMDCGQCKTIVWFEPYEKWKFLSLVHGIIKLHFSPILTKYLPLSPCILLHCIFHPSPLLMASFACFSGIFLPLCHRTPKTFLTTSNKEH